MGKFGVRSWLKGPSPKPASSDASSGDIETKKKKNRLSLAAFSKADTLTPSQEKSSINGHASLSQMVALAKQIAADTEKLDDFMHAKGLPNAGFDINAPSTFPPLPEDMQKLRQDIANASLDLNRLVRGPREVVRYAVWGTTDALSLNIIYTYRLANLVPFGSAISLNELQTKTPLDPVNLARSLRYAMTNGIFREPSPGMIAHTAASRVIAEDEALQDWIGFNTNEYLTAAGGVLSALKEYPEATSNTHTGFNFGHNTVGKEPMFVTMGKDPLRAKRMGRAMASLTGSEGYELSYFVDNHDFTAVDKKGGKFVDIGGSHGFVSVELAKKWENMTFVVQDLPKTVASAPKPISEDGSVAKRIEFQAHDFFTEQPVKDADVYYFRWIVHNQSTPYAITMLRSLIPALKPGARVIINDICLREPGSETPWDEKLMRGMDMVMLALLNAQERDEAEFRELFKAADEQFVFQGVTRVPGCRMSVVEAVWEPKDMATSA